MRFKRGFSGMPEGMVESAAATAAKYGIITADKNGINEFIRQMEPMMTRAGETSLNRAAVMQNMVSYMATMASRGLQPASLSSIGNYISGFSGIAGRTGEAPLSLSAGLSGFKDRILHDPFATVASTVGFSGQFHNMGDIRKWMNKNDPGSYDKLMSDPGSAGVLRGIEQGFKTNGGNMNPFMTRSLFEVMDANPALKLAAALDNPLINDPTRDPNINMAIIQAQTGAAYPVIQSAMDARRLAMLPGMSPAGQAGAAALGSRFQKNLGLTAIGAAALVGNLQQESGLDPKSLNKTSGAFGLANWLDTKGSPRKSAVLAFMKAHPELSPMEAESQFVEQEIQKPGYAAMLQTLRTPGISLAEATLAVRKQYEGPGEAEANDARRLRYAGDTLRGMGGAGGPTTAAGAVATDEDLRRANAMAAVAGISQLSISLLTLNEIFSSAGIVAKAFGIVMDAASKKTGEIGHSLAPPAGAPDIGGITR